MTPNQLMFMASSQKDHLNTNSTGFTPYSEMTSRIKHLQFAILYPFTRVTNTKLMTPNQLRLRASGFKGFRHIPLGPCSGFKAKIHDYRFFFFFFSFFFSFSFCFFFSFPFWKTTLVFKCGKHKPILGCQQT